MHQLTIKAYKAAVKVFKNLNQDDRHEIFDAWPKEYLEEFFEFCLEKEEYEVCGYIVTYRGES